MVSLLNKAQDLHEIFKNTYLEEQLPTIASVISVEALCS